MRKPDGNRIRVPLNLSIDDAALKSEIKAYPLPAGVTLSDIFTWLFKAAVAERKNIPDEVFRDEMFADPVGREAYFWIRKRIKSIKVPDKKVK